MVYRRFRYILILFWCFIFSAFAQKINYQVFSNIYLNTEATGINCFAQDKQGLIWIGSNKGLFSYDGYSVQSHYLFGDRTNTQVYSVLVIDDYLLCLATDNGVFFYNYRKDQYKDVDTVFPADVRSILLDGSQLWIGSLNGLYTYNLKNKQLEELSSRKNNGLPHKTIYSIIKAENNKIYIGTYDGFCMYNARDGIFETITLPLDAKRNNRFVNSLLEDTGRNCIWIGMEGALLKYMPDTKVVEEIKEFHDNSIKSLVLDRNGNLLLGTDNGLYVYNDSSDEIHHLLHDSRNERSLSNNIIWSLFSDREKNVWIGTDYGISLSRYNNIFNTIPISEITGIGDGNRFHVIYKDSRQNYWLGGANGLILSSSLSDATGNAIWYKMGDPKYPLSHNRVRKIYEDKDHNLWIATDASISRFDYSRKQFIHYNIVDSTHTLNANWAYDIFEDNQGQLWIATCLGGIFVVDKQKLINSSSKTYIADHNYSIENGLSGNFINRIMPDHNGNIWILLYNNNGINKINTDRNQIVKIPVETGTNNENPNCIICDKDGFLWIGFRGGLVQINPKNNESKFIPLDASGNNEILSLSEESNHIWISTTDGVWVLDRYTEKLIRLNITSKSFTSTFFDKDVNKIYLGGSDELAILSPDILQQSAPDAPVIITSLLVNDKVYLAGKDYNGNSIRYLDKIELNYKQNNLKFRISDMIYSSEEGTKFQYILEGLDKEWNVFDPNQGSISYSNLEYGRYKLILSRLDSSGKLSDKVYSFTIQVHPPWYYTVWAKCIYILLFFALLLWIFNFFRVRNNLRIERIEREKMVELSNLKIDFFTNVSHEFKTPLSLIIAPVSRLITETKDTQKKKQLELIQQNALKLNSLIRQVLDFNRPDNRLNENLILSKIEIVEFARSILSVYEEGYKDKGLRFAFKTNRPRIYLYLDVLKMESVLNNLISNACKYTQNGDNISLAINVDEEQKEVKIILSDTGIGIPLQDMPYVFERFYQSSKTSKMKEGTGIGLYLAKTYSEQHGGTIAVASEENKSTIITITFPLRGEVEFDIEDDAQSEELIQEENKPFILVVDDNAEIADFIMQSLNTQFRVEVAHNGKMGLDIARKNRPDLIIADVMMPVMDGLEMSRRIRKDMPTSTIPIILLTAKDDKTTELESINLNVDAFISKPFDPQMLLSRIRQLLKSKQQLEEKLRIETISDPKPIESESPDERFLSEIISIIEEKIADPDLNVNALSEISGIGSKQIYRKLKQLTGVSPVEYIRTIRLKKAAMLLTQKKFTIAEVMYMVGFSNRSYFSKSFQAEFGKTPREFIDSVD